MLKVVNGTCKDGSQNLQICQVCVDSSLGHEEMHSLGDIGCMDTIVIRIIPVSRLNGSQKIIESLDINVKFVDQIVFLEEVEAQEEKWPA